MPNMDKTLTQQFGERLRRFRLSLGATTAELARAIGQRQGSISVVEAGRNMLSVAAIEALCARYAMNAHWLITGYGTMLIQPVVGGRIAEATPDFQAPYPFVTIPVVEGLLPAGQSIEWSEAREREGMQVLSSLVPHPQHSYAVRFNENIMAPVIQTHFLVVIDTHPDALHPAEDLRGRPVAVRLGDRLSIRWFEVGKRDWVLYAENDAAGLEPIHIPRLVDPPVVGRVIWWCPSL